MQFLILKSFHSQAVKILKKYNLEMLHVFPKRLKSTFLKIVKQIHSFLSHETIEFQLILAFWEKSVASLICTSNSFWILTAWNWVDFQNQGLHISKVERYPNESFGIWTLIHIISSLSTCEIRKEYINSRWKGPSHYVRFSRFYWHFGKSIIFVILYPKCTLN